MIEVSYKDIRGVGINLRSVKPIVLDKITGADNLQATVETWAAPGQDGAFYESSRIEMRNLTLEGTIVDKDVGAVAERMRQLRFAFMPKQLGTLQYRNREIGCTVESVAFGKTNVSRAITFLISLLCPSPYWRDIEMMIEDAASFVPMFRFPVVFHSTPDIRFGIRESLDNFRLYNPGDVSCGCEIILKTVNEDVENPRIALLETGEYIQLDTVLSAGRAVSITTHFAGKNITETYMGNTSNAMQFMHFGSTFFQLPIGSSSFYLHADSGIKSLEAIINYKPQYLGA